MKTNIADIKDLPSVELGGGSFTLAVRRKQRKAKGQALPDAFLGFPADMAQPDIARILTKSADVAKHEELSLRLHRNALDALCQAATEKAAKAEIEGKLGELSFAAFVANAIVTVGNRAGGEMTDGELAQEYIDNIVTPVRNARRAYEAQHGPKSFDGSEAYTALKIKLCGSEAAFAEAVAAGKAAVARTQAEL